MTHLSDDDLVLLHYRDEAGPGAEDHVAGCAECAERLAALGQTLALLPSPEAPERGEDYGARVWERLRPQLALPEPRPMVVAMRSRLLPRAASFLALAAALVLAFLLGRRFPDQPQPLSAEVRERVLLVAVGEHLERSQMVLIELQHATGNGSVDIKSEREWAEQLVPANRLYRQAAVRAGEPGVASVLDDLERVLVEIAASPDQLPSASLEEIRQRIEAQGILFKVRVLGSQVRERGKGREAQGDWRKS